MNESFKSRVRQARREAGLRQSDLADAVGVTPRAIAMWEAGDRTPRIHLLKRIADATDKPVAWFLEEVA